MALETILLLLLSVSVQVWISVGVCPRTAEPGGICQSSSSLCHHSWVQEVCPYTCGLCDDDICPVRHTLEGECVHGTIDGTSCECSCEDGMAGSRCEQTERCVNRVPLYTDDPSICSPPIVCLADSPDLSRCPFGCQECIVPCSYIRLCYNGGVMDERTCTCVCPFEWSGEQCLADSDECTEGTYECHENSHCVNSLGSYSCECNAGYTSVYGHTETCVDTDECAIGSHDCPEYSTCENVVASYRCPCNEGFTLIGGICNATDCVSNRCSRRSDCYNWTDEVTGAHYITCDCHPAHSGQYCFVEDY